MAGNRGDPPQSSLPSSLIPHLYTGPQESADNSDTGATLPLPASSTINEGIGLTEHASSLTLPPLVPAFSAISTRDESPHGSSYSSYRSLSPVTTEHILNARAPSPAERSGSAMIARSLASLSIPSRHGYVNPIYSSPIYHMPPSRPQTFSHGRSSTYSLPLPQDIGVHRGSWREGEAGPSSLVYPPSRSQQRRSRGYSQPAERTLELDFDTSGPTHDDERHLSRDPREVDRGLEGVRNAIPRTSRVSNCRKCWELILFIFESRILVRRTVRTFSFDIETRFKPRF